VFFYIMSVVAAAADVVLSLAQIDALQCARPLGVKIKHPDEHVSKKGMSHSMGIYVLSPNAMSPEARVRELIQNFIDQCACSNGTDEHPITTGINLFVGMRGACKVIVLYSAKFKLGEIIKYPSETGKVSFVNYGPNITGAQQLFGIGNSTKVGVQNQIGKNGEGLNRAIASFIYKDQYNVTIETVMKKKGGTTFRELTMHANSKGCVSYNETIIEPTQLNPGHPDDQHRIVVSVVGRNQLQFDFFDYVNSDWSCFRDPLNDKDAGFVLVDPKFRARVFARHMHVAQYRRVCFRYGYDFFLTDLPRDRDHLTNDVVTMEVARVWNRLIEHQPQTAELFYTEILMKPSESAVDTFYECDAIKHLSTAAVVILVGLFKKAHPNLIPVSASSKDKLRTRLSKQVLVCPDHAIVLFCRDPSTNFRELMAQHQKLLTEAADVTAQHPTFIANVRPVFVNIFASITIASSECKSIMCYWHIKDENRLILNQSYIQNMSDDLIIEEIACGIMPKISEDRQYRGVFIANLKKKLAPPPPPLPSSPPSAAAPLQQQQQQQQQQQGPKRKTGVSGAPPKKRELEWSNYEEVDSAEEYLILKKKK
jgi:hypothetical protein